MNKVKSLFALVLPVTVLAITSCSGGKKTLNFAGALDYVTSNYDIHSYDDVKGHYSVTLDNLNLDTGAKVYDDNGLAYTGSAAFGLKGIQFGLDNIPSLCMNSYILNRINVMYTKYAAISAEFITHIGADFTYEVENGCLAITLATTSADGLLNIIKSALPALNVYLRFFFKGFESKEADKAEAGTVTAFTSTVLAPVAAPLTDFSAFNISESGGDEEGMIAKIMGVLQNFVKMGIGMTPNSSGNGSLSLKVTTDNEGFLNGLTFAMEATNLDLHMATGVLPTDKETVTLPNYSFDVTGNFKLGFSVAVTF